MNDWVLYDYFIDDGISGKNIKDRPTRSARFSRSNSAKIPIILINIRPTALLVSNFSVTDEKLQSYYIAGKGDLVINEEEAELVRLTYQNYLSGKAMISIAKDYYEFVV